MLISALNPLLMTMYATLIDFSCRGDCPHSLFDITLDTVCNFLISFSYIFPLDPSFGLPGLR